MVLRWLLVVIVLYVFFFKFRGREEMFFFKIGRINFFFFFERVNLGYFFKGKLSIDWFKFGILNYY